jgi:hypothetical protein
VGEGIAISASGSGTPFEIIRPENGVDLTDRPTMPRDIIHKFKRGRNRRGRGDGPQGQAGWWCGGSGVCGGREGLRGSPTHPAE